MEHTHRITLPSRMRGVVINRHVTAIKKQVGPLTQEQFYSVFSNPLITAKIMLCMNFSDLKNLLQVPSYFLGIIETHKRFKITQLLSYTVEKSPLSDIDILQNSVWKSLVWRNIRNIQIDVYHLERQFPQTIPSVILNNAQFVSLLSKDLEYDDKEPVPVRSIQNILKSTHKITHLKLDIRFLLRSLNQDVFQISGVKDNLKNLKHLDIFGWNGRYGRSFYLDSELFNHFLKNFESLASIFQRLESLHLPRIRFFQSDRHQIQTTIVSLLQRNHDTLRELSLHFGIWDNIIPVILPHVNNLTVTIYNKDQESLKNFLVENQDSLVELDVAVKDKFGKNLFDVIRQRSPYLRKLHLTTKRFVDLTGRDEKVDWTFLREMKQLKDFHLSRPSCNEPNWELYGTGPELLKLLPRSQLESLGLRGIGTTRQLGFWRPNYGEPEPELPFKLDLLRGLRNLRRLSLRYCTDAVDDNIMRFIVSEMKLLEELEVSHCSRLTDRGIVGTSEDNSDSTRNLRGLKAISIRSCPYVTPDGILSCFHFPFLRRFDYVAARRVSISFVKSVLSQNPNLKYLAANFECSKQVMLREVNYPRLTTLINLYDRESGADSDSEAEKSDVGESDSEDIDDYDRDMDRSDVDDSDDDVSDTDTSEADDSDADVSDEGGSDAEASDAEDRNPEVSERESVNVEKSDADASIIEDSSDTEASYVEDNDTEESDNEA